MSEIEELIRRGRAAQAAVDAQLATLQQQKHTPEPWHTGGQHGRIIYTADGQPVADATVYHGRLGDPIKTATANAARIVACVNACAGMDDPAADIELLRSKAEEALFYCKAAFDGEGSRVKLLEALRELERAASAAVAAQSPSAIDVGLMGLLPAIAKACRIMREVQA